VFSVGPPYRKPIYTNREYYLNAHSHNRALKALIAWLITCLIGLGAFSTYVLLTPARPIARILDIIDFTLRFRIELLVIAAVNIVVCFAFERFVERPIARLISQTKRYIRKRRGRDRRLAGQTKYKQIEGDMR